MGTDKKRFVFLKAEDGIRDADVTGVQTCALPISHHAVRQSALFVIKEIEEGRLPHRMVGTHRRIAFEDLLAYARKMREKQAAALERMAENARELGLDY